MHKNARFCSNECLSLSTGKKSPKDRLRCVSDPHNSLPHPLSHTSAISSAHRELLYVFAECDPPDVYFDLTLAVGNDEEFPREKVYCIQYYRGIRTQHLVGFFISDQLEPINKKSALSSFFPNTVLPPVPVTATLISRFLLFIKCTDVKSLLSKHK